MQVTHTHRNSLTDHADGGRSTTIISDCAVAQDCIVYSPYKYRETEGIKDIGLNDWNQGRTQEIKERYVHLGGES